MKNLFNNKTVIGTLPAYLLVAASFFAMIAPQDGHYDYLSAIISLLASTEFIAVSFCYLFTVAAYETNQLEDKCFSEIVFSIFFLTIAFLIFKQNPITIEKQFDYEKYSKFRFSFIMPIVSIFSFIYTVTFYKRVCKKK